MSTCKDCIHEKACKQILVAAFGYEVSENYKGNAENCDTFKNKADYVEVVRCKECVHRNPNCYKCMRDNLWHDKYDFCSYGERKEDENA